MSSENNYLQPVNNHFNDDNDDDVDDDAFLANSRTQHNPKKSTNPFVDDVQQVYEQKRKEIEERTLQSSNRSLGLLCETEEVGKATASELAKQREQLEKTSRQIEEINSTLRFSQRHLNGLKSVFGGLKNYLSGNRDNMSPRTASSPSGSALGEDLPSSSAPVSPDEVFENHPVNRIRSDNIQGQQRYVEQKGEFDTALQSNLENMCDSLSRLKGLATDMRGEIESQNDLLDNMNYRIEDVDLKIGKQTNAMNKLLGKK
ncbi:synaptosomal-associated protein 29 [Eupeodes corollae]|uniref:synaptosomal-associated protein 29 n=1 Tax=Eupeodes corollae TaxID=290404 RepID=UPI0024921BCA|nr:synaptosomal-associated protein 29 [Eupeodes corollae]XP_055904013.1 synaptosomal-associated protein 29 [Eupeodes corollae]